MHTHKKESGEPLAYDAQTLARLLGVSLRHIRRMDAIGLLPRPIQVSGALLS